VTSEAGVDRQERRFRDGGHRGAPPGGARQLTAILPNGRTIWLRVERPLAPATSANHVARLAERLVERRAASTAAQARETDQLSALVVGQAALLQRARLGRARAFRRRLVARDDKLDQRLRKARDEFHSRLEKQLKIDRESIRRLRRRDLWDKVLLATALPLFVAYGDRKNPVGSKSLTLAFLLLLWLAGDQVVEAVFGSDSKSPYPVPDADAWSYLAPIGNVLAAWWLLGDRQHERFVTGITTVKLKKQPHGAFYRYRATVDLSDHIAKGHFEDFATFAQVPAVATFGSVRLSNDGKNIGARVERLSARVDGGSLTLSFRVVPQHVISPPPTDLGEMDIAWMVDTDKPSTDESGK
jgi:RNAse (barnase) inhibitor barstar